MVKTLPAMQEMQVQSMGREDPLEKETATHSSIFAREIPQIDLFSIKYIFPRATDLLFGCLFFVVVVGCLFCFFLLSYNSHYLRCFV